MRALVLHQCPVRQQGIEMLKGDECDHCGTVAGAPPQHPTGTASLISFPDLTPDEARNAWSESGHGWTLDGMYPFFPGTPCVHCGRFVGRDGVFNVEHFEMSTEIASMDAEHRDCPRDE